MTRDEFNEIRKKLEKTQKEIATLLGVSLKAVCSYEQGWRTVPGHIERQLYFLLSRKMSIATPGKNCWDIKDCPEEIKKNCPAYEFDSGQCCWFFCGTGCTRENRPGQDRMEVCKSCKMMKKLNQE